MGQDGYIELKIKQICPADSIHKHLGAQQEYPLQKGLTGTWTWHYTFMGQDGSIETQMEWIGLLVLELQHL